ncbi:hypothetical protein NPIL_175171 [Nephila pilipes]|uniref:Uncharacterized protein n=1 Tax=Nephila pilipes TaxID=299642 RepID=A0A8X6TYX0_NEPPI|nr:hypothetical protein NPIL_175171 [Nephila pilipes]
MVHPIQTTCVPVLMYKLQASSLKCREKPNLYWRSFEPYDQMQYHWIVLEPHTCYLIPAGTHYILMNIRKIVFALNVIPDTVLPIRLQNGFHLGDYQKSKLYHQKAYKLPPPTPAEERPANNLPRHKPFFRTHGEESI